MWASTSNYISLKHSSLNVEDSSYFLYQETVCVSVLMHILFNILYNVLYLYNEIIIIDIIFYNQKERNILKMEIFYIVT